MTLGRVFTFLLSADVHVRPSGDWHFGDVMLIVILLSVILFSIHVLRDVLLVNVVLRNII
jgi:hypothetical protein